MGGSSRVSSYADAQQFLQSSRGSREAFTYSEQATRSGVGKVHKNLDPKNVVRECLDSAAMPLVTPIAFAMDVTQSRGGDARIVYEQLMPFLGKLYLSGAVSYPQLLFAAFGDATADRAPLQVGQFESDDRMDKDLERMWLEAGGGGTGEESAELAAYFIARKTNVDAIDTRGTKGYCFFTSDEAPYPMVKKDEVQRIIGDTIKADIPSPKIFAELQKRFDTFLIYPAKSLADRQGDIDKEIRQRLQKAGGRFENCSIRASLIWNTYDDLDLHVVTPKGEEIFFGRKVATCGGELDVDRNAGGPQTREPVENIRWAKGTAAPGKYLVYVQNYRHHERSHKDISFKVELEVEGSVKTFVGVAKADVIGRQSDITAFEFTYSPEAATVASVENHASYTDEVILAKWRSCIPDGHIVRVKDAKHTTEAVIGIMALKTGKKSLADVCADMKERAVSQLCIDDVEAALLPLSKQVVSTTVDEAVFA
jgi:hypothetical protein